MIFIIYIQNKYSKKTYMNINRQNINNNETYKYHDEYNECLKYILYMCCLLIFIFLIALIVTLIIVYG